MRGFSSRYIPALLLGAHFVTRIFSPRPQIVLDLFLFNIVALALVVMIARNRAFLDHVGRGALASAVALWGIGSTLSSYSEFFPRHFINPHYANAFYVAMYPVAFIGLQRALQGGKRIRSIEILDSAIFGIGLSAVGSAFFIAPVLPHFGGDAMTTFFAVLFPIADLVLVALVFSLALISSFSMRSVLLCVGISIFGVADFVFLGTNIRGTYSLGSISDDLWLLGLVIIAEALHHRNTSKANVNLLHPLFIVLTVLMCATLLAINSLRPQYLPQLVAFPAITTLLLAFARMTIALKEAAALGQERTLARTDELTGLPNRRKFLMDLAAQNENPSHTSALLLMDLDGFKPINDSHGHDVGDILLQEVTKRFSRALPHGSILARLGGDEFGAIIQGTHESTMEVALALRATLSYPFTFGSHEISIGVSIGHVMNDGSPHILRRADLAMYEAKREGIGVWAERS